MYPAWTWTTAFNGVALLMISCRGWPNKCTFCPWDHPNPRFDAQNCGIFLSMFRYLWDFCWTQGCLPDCISVQLHARYSVPFWQSSVVRYTGLPRDWVRCVSLAQKISNRTDCPLLVRKPLQICFALHLFSWWRSLIDNLSSFVKGVFINKLWRNNDVTLMTLHYVSCSVGSLHLLVSSFGTLENICTKFTHIYHRNDSTSPCIVHSIYIFFLEDVIGSDVGGDFYGPHCISLVFFTVG